MNPDGGVFSNSFLIYLKFCRYLNAQAGPLLKTPLHVAIESKNLQVVTELMNAGAQMDLKDLMENNIMHFAAKSSAEILKVSSKELS